MMSPAILMCGFRLALTDDPAPERPDLGIGLQIDRAEEVNPIKSCARFKD